VDGARVIIRDAASNRWLRFEDPCEIIETARLDEVLPCLRRMESRIGRERLYAVGMVGYEAAPAFDSALSVRGPGRFPLLWFGLYHRGEPIELPRPPASAAVRGGIWQPSIGRGDYEAAIAQIKQCIARGETYQVNYTLRLRRSMTEDPWALFLELAAAQESPYAAFLDLPDFAVCSASPELFFSLLGDRLLCRPMKGTAARGRWYAEDAAAGEWLSRSAKNRAENAMIVDMMRNDVGRIARLGSVQVRDLFRTERYPTLWQMTSLVEARTEASLCEILRALFPCASVTGAPKPSTMGIIARLETAPRGIYTGAIGMIAPDRRAEFSVAIRTVVVDKARHAAEYGVGGGVVWDSTSADEYRECLLKARVLGHRRPAFSLLESLLWTPAEGYFLFDEHLRRLGQSAEYFGFPPCTAEARRELAVLAGSLPELPHKVRLLASRDGRIACEAAPIAAADAGAPVRLRLAETPVDAADLFLYHKTTHRAVYESAAARCRDADDVLLYNQHGQVTETCNANLVVRHGGELWTPPLACGLLAGTFRARLLAEGTIRERPMDVDAVRRGEELFVVNSVRKWRRAMIVG
jgi:para-aminobenzoate synthetase/4-amino-4-deoxychorismate lyase